MSIGLLAGGIIIYGLARQGARPAPSQDPSGVTPAFADPAQLPMQALGPEPERDWSDPTRNFSGEYAADVQPAGQGGFDLGGALTGALRGLADFVNRTLGAIGAVVPGAAPIAAVSRVITNIIPAPTLTATPSLSASIGDRSDWGRDDPSGQAVREGSLAPLRERSLDLGGGGFI